MHNGLLCLTSCHFFSVCVKRKVNYIQFFLLQLYEKLSISVGSVGECSVKTNTCTTQLESAEMTLRNGLAKLLL